MGLVRRRQIAVFLSSAFGVGLTTPFVYQVLPTYLESRGFPRAWIATTMTLGQVPEIATLAVLPVLFRRIGTKATMALGIAAWAVRYATLIVDPPLWIAVTGIPLHGVAIACFSVGGQVFIDGHAPAHRRAGAQALLMVFTSGVGSLVGCILAGESAGRLGGDSATVFLVPCVINLALIIYFCAGFRADSTTDVRTGATDAPPPFKNEIFRGGVARIGTLVTESADG